MTIVTVGIDLAKNVFAVHGVDATGKATLIRPSVPRAKLGELIAALAPCLIGMEACSGAHHWARLFATYGHAVRVIAPKFVTPSAATGLWGRALIALSPGGAGRHDESAWMNQGSWGNSRLL